MTTMARTVFMNRYCPIRLSAEAVAIALTAQHPSASAIVIGEEPTAYILTSASVAECSMIEDFAALCEAQKLEFSNCEREGE